MIHLINTLNSQAQDQWDPNDDVYTGAINLVTPTVDLQTHGPHTLDVKWNNDHSALTNKDYHDWFKFELSAGRYYEFIVDILFIDSKDNLQIDFSAQDFMPRQKNLWVDLGTGKSPSV